MTGETWRPTAGPGVAKNRASLLRRAREFFDAREILEVDTPILSKFAVTDPYIESLSACSVSEADLFLHTSPEYKMKRLLAAGFGDICQICKVFRDGEIGRHHLLEFTMVEWYRLNFGLQEIMRDSIDFVATLLDRSDLLCSAEIISYQEAFRKTVNLNPLTADVAELAICANADEQLTTALGDNRDRWLDLVLANRVVPGFPPGRLTVICHYPASQAALARHCPDDAEVADRFEVYYGDLELANGFVELTDAEEQLSRFERDRDARRESGKTDYQIDAEFMHALRAGLPPCAGVAVGLDRLLMLHQGQCSLSAISNFACNADYS